MTFIDHRSQQARVPINASMLYALVTCPHRVTMDLFADPAERDPVSPFVQLLWDRGTAHEKDVIAGVGTPFLDLSCYAGDEKERRTLAAMDRGEPLIYSGRISADELLGVPDLLRKEVGGYVAGDIKSGAGEEGGSDEEGGKLKESYAMQLALYTDILEQLGRSAGRRGFIWDIHGEEVPYDLTELQGVRNPRALWDDYHVCLAEARTITTRTVVTRPAYSSGDCKNCVWYTACIKALEATDDLTLIPGLGRSKRDVMIERISSIREEALVATKTSANTTLHQRVMRELKELVFISVYLYITLGAVILMKTAVLHSEGIAFTPWGIAIVKAVVLAKFMLLGSAAKLGERTTTRTRPLIWPTLEKAFAFLVLLIILTTIEEAVVGLFHHQSISASLGELFGPRLQETIAGYLVMLLVLIPYSAFMVLAQAFGEGQLARMFFVEPQPMKQR